MDFKAKKQTWSDDSNWSPIFGEPNYIDKKKAKKWYRGQYYGRDKYLQLIIGEIDNPIIIITFWEGGFICSYSYFPFELGEYFTCWLSNQTALSLNKYNVSVIQVHLRDIDRSIPDRYLKEIVFNLDEKKKITIAHQITKKFQESTVTDYEEHPYKPYNQSEELYDDFEALKMNYPKFEDAFEGVFTQVEAYRKKHFPDSLPPGYYHEKFGE